MDTISPQDTNSIHTLLRTLTSHVLQMYTRLNKNTIASIQFLLDSNRPTASFYEILQIITVIYVLKTHWNGLILRPLSLTHMRSHRPYVEELETRVLILFSANI
jgi:hypothetical protein